MDQRLTPTAPGEAAIVVSDIAVKVEENVFPLVFDGDLCTEKATPNDPDVSAAEMEIHEEFLNTA